MKRAVVLAAWLCASCTAIYDPYRFDFDDDVDAGADGGPGRDAGMTDSGMGVDAGCQAPACCTQSADCDEPELPVCDGTQCIAGCTASADCMRFAGTAPACDVASGECVECTAGDPGACGANVCDGSTNTCTTRPARAKNLCEDCVSDDECLSGQLCIPMTFMGTDVGQFCLWLESAPAGPNGACVNARPYVLGTSATSVDGVTARVCSLRVTTCDALSQFSSLDCDDGTVPGTTDEQCGVADLADGLCRFSTALSASRCTVPCISDDDCAPTTTCRSTTPGYCDF